MTERPAPDEDAVREELKAERETIEEQDGSGAPEAPEPDARPESQDPVAKAESERDKYLELAQRTQADFENYRKRAAKEAAAADQRAKIGLLRELLPVLDNLERALDNVTDGEAALAEGVRLVHNELTGVLQRSGVEEIEAEGKQFDPTVHEAISTQPSEDSEAGAVLHVVEKGFKLGDTVIRPTRVVVSA